MNIDFYYWGDQCPFNSINIKQLNKLQELENFDINYYDFSSTTELAKDKSFFSPTFTIINNSFRWTGPLWDSDIEKLKMGILPTRFVIDAIDGSVIIEKDLIKLNKLNSIFIKDKCTSSQCEKECLKKSEWLGKLEVKYNLDFLGILHVEKNRCIGGAEFIPSLETPYNIPKSDEIAFLTCIYSSDSYFDFKDYPLRELEKLLFEAGFNKLCGIASEYRTFPNGTLNWFLDRGFEKVKFLYYEEVDMAEQYLFQKKLEPCGF